MSDTVRTFRAATAEEAMAQVRREMGLDAQVIDVQQASSRGLFSWFSARQEVEVKASVAAVKHRAGLQDPAENSRATFPTNKGTIAAAAAKLSNSTLSNSTTGAAKSRVAKTDPAPNVANRRDFLEAPAEQLPRFDMDRPHNSRFAAPEITSPSTTVVPRPNLFSNSPVAPNNATIEQRLDVLQQMIADLGRSTQPGTLAQIPPELFPHYLTLIEADVDDEIARDLILKLQRHAAPGQLNDMAASMALLTVLIEQRISCGEGLSPKAGQQQIAMLVGPTGVGKTTTLAKLAGNFSVNHGRKLGLITVDTYRVAAVEQLRMYAQIIDLPMRVVNGSAQISQALDSLADCELILIDTAGRSPYDDCQLDELKNLVDASRPDHVYLVLSLTSGAKALRNAAERFAAARPTSLVFTKLDEAIGCGGLLAASRDIGLPISYLTTGQEVPRDIEPANPCRAARLILGTDHMTKKSIPCH